MTFNCGILEEYCHYGVACPFDPIRLAPIYCKQGVSYVAHFSKACHDKTIFVSHSMQVAVGW